MTGWANGGGAKRLRALLRERGHLSEEDYVVYLSAEWTSPVDKVVVPFIKQKLVENASLVVVSRGEYALHGAAAHVPSIACEQSEFREICRELGVTRLPMCVAISKPCSEGKSSSTLNAAILDLIEAMNQSSSVHEWMGSVADTYPPLAVDDPSLVELRQQATTLFEQGDFVGGATGFTRALLHCPTCVKANFNMSVILQMMDELYFAVDHMLRVVMENDQDAVAHSVLRTVLHPAEPDLVIRGYEAIVAQHEDHYRAAHSLATLRGEAITAAPAYVRQVFDHLAETFEEKLVTHLEYRVPWQIVEALQRSKALPQNDMDHKFTVVDLGCGTGLCGRLLRPFASHIAGIDLSPLMIDKSRESGYYDEAETADIIPFLSSKTDGSIDLIVSADVWIYVGALDEIFPLVVAKLRPSGWFAFSTEVLTAGDGFQLAASGRFKHADSYIKSLATQNGFIVQVEDEITVRKESGEPITGRVFVLKLST